MAPLPSPALFPPADGTPHTWPAPNFVNPDTRDWTASACIIALFIVTLSVFCARIYARFVITRTPGLDDWLMIASMPVLLGFVISTVLGLRIYGFQLHIYDQTPRTQITVRQITLAIEILYLITSSLTKISILTFYRRLTSSLISRRLFIIIWAAIVFVAAYCIAFVFVLLFTCWPVEAYWYRFSRSWLMSNKYHCHDELTTLVIIISISTAQDLLACIIPMFIIRKLHLPRRQKIALGAIFLTGLAVCAIGALRVHYAHRVYHYVKTKNPTYDITWEALGSWVSTAVEANVAVICASAPALNAYCGCLRQSSDRAPPRNFDWYDEPSQTPSSVQCLSIPTGKVRSLIPWARSSASRVTVDVPSSQGREDDPPSRVHEASKATNLRASSGVALRRDSTMPSNNQ
ncbi:hypothetical protein BU24DRAFT_464763 [Aaosphaeria arxii CBS 175.79]|uniref:Rhodopsin domain-containing protein n=1 Tax=Aaosphaeria arxii CBS 175.79 TaxID=1450172 RepID=A0A6A5XMS3_9PLEO|nr:uncharacterized protein BU24DRAFT_464763 [Aaosphaeria arxii CBS 175.79]KAF2014050.1 hypothetical protein BU24DRAFT_464763 [Aaosphaeria arxii CBS 175.79]